MAFVLVARLTARDGEEERAAELLGQLTEATRGEPGNHLYIPHRDPEDPHVFLVYEQYADKDAFEAHGASDHFKAIGVEQLFPLMDGRERNFYETL
jgi:quinol monooxygenase YgiN